MLAALTAAVGAPAGFAAETRSVQQVITVTMAVAGTCSLRANDLNFGNYDPRSGTGLLAQSSLDVTCTSGLSYKITLDAGQGGGTTQVRKMTGGGGGLEYSLYRNSARTQVWGETPGVDTVQASGTGVTQRYQMYGKVPAGQSLMPGTYSDVITVRILF